MNKRLHVTDFLQFLRFVQMMHQSQQKIRTRSMHDRFVKFTSYYNQITMVAKKQHGARQSDHIRSLNILDYNEYTFMHGSICLICTSFLIDQEHARI